MIDNIRIDIRQKRHSNGLSTIENMQLDASSGEFVAIVGPSGAGKTTLLKIISGLDREVDGEVTANDAQQSLWSLNPDIGFVFQEPRLMPWLTVQQNMQLVVAVGSERHNAIESLLQQVGLADFASAYPSQLSGGMQRRVGLARAFINQPELLLLDEPFQSLDEPTANELRALLLTLWQSHRPTVFFVTHQLREALAMADRVVFVSARPASVILDYRVPLERPREIESEAINRLSASLLAQHPQLLSGISEQ